MHHSGGLSAHSRLVRFNAKDVQRRYAAKAGPNICALAPASLFAVSVSGETFVLSDSGILKVVLICAAMRSCQSCRRDTRSDLYQCLCFGRAARWWSSLQPERELEWPKPSTNMLDMRSWSQADESWRQSNICVPYMEGCVDEIAQTEHHHILECDEYAHTRISTQL